MLIQLLEDIVRLDPKSGMVLGLEYSPVSAVDFISESIEKLNKNFHTVFNSISVLNLSHEMEFTSVVNYYQKYGPSLLNSIELHKTNVSFYDDFLTTVVSNSSKWLQPMSTFYPTLIKDPLNNDDILNINNWLRYFYPIRNEDKTLNYVNGQKFLLNCYTYKYIEPLSELAQPYSYCECQTQSGNISLHCKTQITGGWIHCNQGNYLCNKTIDCYPQKNVDCWYESPYLHEDSTIINKTDLIETKQSVISKIQANITMNYQERRETELKTLVFIVNNCDWEYNQQITL